jgi:hypothetical protein
MSVCLLDGHGIVRGDVREPEIVDPAVDHDDGQAPVGQLPVVVVLGVSQRIRPSGEDDAADLVVEQHLDVVGLRDAAYRAGAEGRGEPPLRQGGGDHLGEGGKDRILQFGQDQTDEASALAPQLGRTLVPEDVQGGEHRRAGRLGNATAAVEHPAHRGLADPGLLCHLGEALRHAAILGQVFANVEHGAAGSAQLSRKPPTGKTRPGRRKPARSMVNER